MNDKNSPPARSEVIGPAQPDSGQDWAIWLQRAPGTQKPRPSAASPAQAQATWTALSQVAQREGFTVERSNCADAEGFTTFRNRRIHIRPNATPVQAVTALAHQLGHVLLHAQIARLEPSGTVPCTGIRKVEADSVAYLAAAHAGIDTTGITFPHVSSWAGTDARARPTTTIQAVTSRIADAAAVITACLEAVGISAPQLPAPARAASPGTPDQLTGPQPPESEHARIHETAALFFCSQMPASWVRGYLARRGLSPAVQEQWHAGYAPAAWDALTSHLRAAGYADTLIEAAGLARRSRQGTLIDTFRDRAVLPIRSTHGTIIAFIGRATDHAAPGTPKYLNSPATSVYRKGEILFGLSEAREALASGARPVIVEGPLDAIAVTTSGNGNYVGVAPCGTALTAHQAAALADAVDLRAMGVTVAFDPDQAGRRAAIRAYHLLVPHTDKLTALTLRAGQDPAQTLANSGPTALAEMLASGVKPLPDLVINTEVARWGHWLRYPEGQIHALRATASLIAAMPSAHIARQVARLAAILRLDHALVTEAVTDALTTLIADSVTSSGDDASARQAISGAPLSAAIRTVPSGSPHSAQQAVEQAAGIVPPPACGSRASTGQPQLTSRRVRG
jgi:DNA primase